MQRFEVRPPLVWTGRGLSWAVAVAASAELRSQGHPSIALSIPELLTQPQSGTVALISRSGQCPAGLRPDLLVTENGACDSAEVIRVENPGDDGHWLSLASARSTLDTILAAAGCARTPGVTIRDDRDPVWIYAAHAHVARALFRAAAHKVRLLGGEAVDCDELGHGLHAQLLAGHPAVSVRGSGDESSDVWSVVQRWFAEAQLELGTHRLGVSVRPAVVFAHSLAVIEAQVTRRGLDISRRPIDDRLDWLREDRVALLRGQSP